MKTVVIIGDGMADYPLVELGGKTPLMAAETEAMDRIAREGRNGLFRTIGPDVPTGSAVANLSVLGYDPRSIFHGGEGRSVLEAASLGIALKLTDLALRVNLICIENGRIKSHSAGHISDEDAHRLIYDLHSHFKKKDIFLYPGLSYRHLLVIPNGDDRLDCAPPHDHRDEEFQTLLVRPTHPEAKPTVQILNELIMESQSFLQDHPVNQRRIKGGLQPANSLWPWSPGKKPEIKTLQERFGVRGAAISAVDLIKGLAIYAGMDVISVKGATGLYDTNYEGKADACLEALNDHDFVYVHVESPDEAGHDRNLKLKIQCIEDLDKRLIGRVLDGMEDRKRETVIAVLPDHPTPIAKGNHTRDPVPVAVRDPRFLPDAVTHFDEKSAKFGSLGVLKGSEFIRMVLSR